MSLFLFDEERSPWAMEFLRRVNELCEEYDMTIEHEEGCGSFILVRGRQNRDWFMDAIEENPNCV